MEKIRRTIAATLAAAMCFTYCPVSVPAMEMESSAAVEETNPVPQVQAEVSVPEVEIWTEPVGEPAEGSAAELLADGEVEIIASGTCGTNAAWELDSNGVMTISGVGDMTSYGSPSSAPWYSYKTSICEIIIGDDITSIGRYSFTGCKSLTSLKLGDSLEVIGDYAFSQCSALKSLELPDSLTKIGPNAFAQCSSLSGTLVIPDSVTTIEGNAFSDCSALSGLDLGSGVTKIDTHAFSNCKKISGELVLPDALTSIGTYAFSGCAALSGTLRIPGAVTTISNNAFYQCTSLTGLVLEDGITKIDQSAFSGCTSLAGTLEIPDSVTTLGANAFNNCSSLTAVHVGSGVADLTIGIFNRCSSVTEITFTCQTPTSIVSNGFSDMTALKRVHIPAAGYTAYMELIGTTFKGVEIVCSDAQTDLLIEDDVLVAYLGDAEAVEIPEGVTRIAAGAFRTRKTVSVMLPETVKQIDPYAFYECSALTQITMPQAEVIGDYAFYGCSALQQVQIPVAKTIGNYAFRGCSSMATIDYGLEVTSIGNYAFYGCSKLASELVLPDTLTSIGQYAFYDCSNMTGSVIIPSGIAAIQAYTFYHCQKLNGILVIPDTVTTIGNYAFNGCKGLTGNLRIPDSVNSLGTSCFYECSGFDGVLTLSSSLTAIPVYAFYNCSKLAGSLRIPDSVTTLNKYCFSGCSGFDGILILSSGLTNIVDYAFNKCSNLTGNLEIPAGVISLGAGCFSGCAGFSGTLTLPAGLTAIPDSVFSGCSNITGTLVIPDGVKNIANNAFYNMEGLSGIELGTGLTTLGSSPNYTYSPFYGCAGLQEVTFRGASVPKIETKEIFSTQSALERVYVPAEAFASYAEVFKAQKIVGTAQIIPIGVEDEFLIQDNMLLSYQGEGGEVQVPEGVTKIGAYAFQGCTTVTKVTLPESVTIIDDYAFRQCTAMTEINLPENLSEIGDYAFSGCESLAMDLVIPDAVTKVGAYAFSACSSLTSLDLGTGVTSIGTYAFANDTGLTGDLVIPDSVTTMGNYAFSGCTGLNGTLTLSENLTELSIGAFNQCPFTGDLVIPDAVTTIGNNAFSENRASTISFGANVTTVGTSTTTSTGSFYTSPEVTEVTFKGATPPTFVLNPFRYMSKLETVYVPAEAFGVYSEKLKSYIPSHATMQASNSESEFLIQDGVLTGYLGEGGEVTIPNTVTAIGSSVFMNNTTITAVVLPEKLTAIGSYAFSGCTALTSINLPDQLVEIGSYAFRNCSGLSCDLVIPNSVTAMGSYAFYNCTKLTSLTLSENLTVIPEYAFFGCKGIKGKLVIPDSVIEIGANAFCSNSNITELELGMGLTTLGGTTYDLMPFCSCSGLKTVTFKSTVMPTIQADLFDRLNNLQSINVPSGSYENYVEVLAKYLPANARFRCPDTEEVFLIKDNVLLAYLGDEAEVVLPTGVTKIGNSAFQNNKTIQKITCSDEITSIGDYAFKGCKSLTEFRFDDSLVYIGQYAFYECTSLKAEMLLPDSITTIGKYAFYKCTALSGNLKLPENLEALNEYTFYGCSKLKGELVIPDRVVRIANYVFTSCQFTSVVIGCSVSEVGMFFSGSTFRTLTFLGTTLPTISLSSSDMQNIVTVYVPQGCYSAYQSTLGARLALGCRILEMDTTEEFLIEGDVLLSYQGSGGDVTVPDGIKTIAVDAFHGCTTVTSVTLPESVTTIGQRAFYGCNAMTRIDLPSQLTTIESYAFYYCKAMTYINLPSRLISIGAYAFYQCTALSGKITIPGSVQFVSNHVFAYCASLTGLKLEDGVTTINFNAFYGCTGMTGDLVIPNSVTSIGQYAFQNCSGFDGNLVLSDGLTSIASYAFDGCSGFTGQLVIPDSVQTISEYAFRGMASLDSLVFGSGLTTLVSSTSYQNAPFYQCSGVTEVIFNGKTVPTIKSDLFYSMANLQTVYVPEASYDAYMAVLSPYLTDTVTVSTDFLNARITDFVAAQTYSHTIALNWSPHTSERVVGYTITCNGEIVGTTDTCQYVVRGLAEKTEYVFTVQGYTADGRTTGIAQVTASTVLPEVLDIKTDSGINKINDEYNTIYIYVTDRKNLDVLENERTIGLLRYSSGGDTVVVGEAQKSEALSTAAVAVYVLEWDLEGIEDGTYEVTFTLTDVDGVSDAYSEMITIDRSVPAQIMGVTAISDLDVIYISWAVAAEQDTHTYRIYRKAETDAKFRMIAQVNNRDTQTYADENIRDDVTYYYYVVGVNDLGQEGVPSLVVGATLSVDKEAPIVTKLTPANGSSLVGTASMTVSAEDNVDVSRIVLEYAVDGSETWLPLVELTGSQRKADVDTTAIADGIIRVRATAYDAAGNSSTPLVYLYKVNNCGPEKIQGLSWTSTHVSVTLRWKDVSDDDIYFFRVEERNEDGTYTLVADVYDTLGINIYDLTPGTSYTYRVIGYDLQGNRGEPSDDITVETLKDTTAPVITMIRPVSGYYCDTIPVIITATDEYAIRNISVQVSRDLLDWETVFTQNYGGNSTSQTLYHDLQLANYEEGVLYIRGIARDLGGNVSDSSVNAPYVQHIVDRTAPDVPQNVSAIGQCGYIEISWVQSSENDLNGYSVYRAESPDGEYELLKSQVTAINYLDREVEEDVTYYYKVAADDLAGNQSIWSEAVFAQVGEDTEPPVILAVYPQTGSFMGAGNNALRVSASDNHVLQSLLIEYSSDGQAYALMYELSDISQYGQNADAKVPVNEFEHGDKVYIRVSAVDKSGNVSEPYVMSYTIDAAAPVVHSADAVYDAQTEQVTISWTGAQEADLYGYRIYRGIKGEYSLLGFIKAVDGQQNYTCTDGNLPVKKVTCVYKVEAVDQCGNTSAVLTSGVAIPDRQYPRAILSCDNTMEVGVEYHISAAASTDNSKIVSYFFDFGDGTTSTEIDNIHTYHEVGEYVLTLTVKDDEGHETTVTKEITVVERSAIGTVTIQVVDENGKALSSVPVYFDLGEETQTMKETDSTGRVIFTAAAGVHPVGAVIANNEWLPAKKDVIVLAGADTSATLILVNQPMIEGEFQVNRMTFEEIEAAGIDTSKPENQYLVSVNVSLNYGSAEIETSFIFNMVTQEPIEEIYYGSGGGAVVDRELIPVVIDETKIALLDVPIGASYLKEFFDVRLYIVNNAATEFAMTDNVVTLNVPEGLTIVAADTAQSGPVVEIDEIPGQSVTTITWILRGDREGEYHLTADYSGILSQFDEPIHTAFVTKEPIKVYGLSAVKLIAEINSSLNYDAFYFNLSMENTSDVDVNLPSIEIADNILSSYLARLENEDEETVIDPEMLEQRMPEVKHINSVLTNASGYSQHIGTENQIVTLSPGETLTKKYAAYNVSGYDNLMHLKEAVYEITEGYGIRFELIQTDMDLFSMDDAAQKLADMMADQSKAAQLKEIMDCSRYFYVLESLDRCTNVFGREGSELYTAMTNQLSVDASCNPALVSELARAVVAQLMVDDSVQLAVEADMDANYLAVTANVLAEIGQWLESRVSAEDWEVWSDYVAKADYVRALAEKVKVYGVAAFGAQLQDALAAAGFSSNGVQQLKKSYAGGIAAAAFTDAIGGLNSMLGSLTATLDEVSEDWYESVELIRGLIYASAAQKQAMQMLDMLIAYTASCQSIYAELTSIRTEMESLGTQLRVKFVKNLTEAAQTSAMDHSVLYECLDTVYGISGGAAYTLVKLMFGSVDDVISWRGGAEDIHVLRVCAQISLALRQAVECYGLSAKSDEAAVYTLTALKYLIKMRLIGEQCYVLSVCGLDEQGYAEALRWVNTTLNTSYESVDRYLDTLQAALLGYRDTLFTSYYTNVDIPEAPIVTLNYLENCTNEVFSSAYEYSFDGSNWKACSGKTISVVPGTANQYLWVRVKETSGSYSGNIAKVVIPGRQRITGDFYMIYMEDGYQISGLPAGTYHYAFTNERGEIAMERSFTVAEGEIVKLLAEEEWTYLAIRQPATDSSFTSQIRYLVAEQPWVINTDTYVVTGMKEETTSMQVINYYGAKGYAVTVISPDGTVVQEVGTGCVIKLDGKSHSVVIQGDVDGDATIGLYDLYLLLDYINGEESIEGVYHQAGCVTGSDDIELFDLLSEVDYITTGSFS